MRVKDLQKTFFQEPASPPSGGCFPESSQTREEQGEDNNDLTNDTIWHTPAQDGPKWDSVESDFISSRLEQPSRPTTSTTTIATIRPTTHDQTSNMTKAHSPDEDDIGDDDQDDDDALLILSQIIDS